MTDAVLFDLDGTILQFTASYADFMREMAARWEISDPTDPFFDHYGTAIRSPGAVTFRSSIATALAATGRSIPADFDDRCAAAVRGYATGIDLLPHAVELIKRYAHYPKAIVSNGPSDMQRAALRKVGLESHFDHILVSGDADVAVRKPDPRIFLMACERLGVSPDRALMIGDSIEADVEGARSAGLSAVHVSELIGT